MKDYSYNKNKDGTIYCSNGEHDDPYSLQVVLDRFPENRVFYNTRSTHIFFLIESQTRQTLDFDFAKLLIRNFITLYKRSANDVFITEFDELSAPLVLESGVCEDLPDGSTKFEATDIQALWDKFLDSHQTIAVDSSEIFNAVSENLISHNHLEYKELFLRASREVYVTGNYKYALLEVFIFIEQIVYRSLKTMMAAKGISNNKIKDFEKEVGIAYKLNIDFPILLPDFHLHEQTFQDVDKIRKKRNAVIHNGDSVTKGEALFAIEASFKLYNILKGHI